MIFFFLLDFHICWVTFSIVFMFILCNLIIGLLFLLLYYLHKTYYMVLFLFYAYINCFTIILLILFMFTSCERYYFYFIRIVIILCLDYIKYTKIFIVINVVYILDIPGACPTPTQYICLKYIVNVYLIILICQNVKCIYKNAFKKHCSKYAQSYHMLTGS